MSETRQITAKYISHRIAKETTQRGEAADLARRLSVSHAHISKVARGVGGTGYDFEVDVARHWGMSHAELEAAALAWWRVESRNIPPEQLAAVPERYPNRAIARAYAIGVGISAEAIAEVDSMALHSEVDPHPDEWLELYRGADRRLRLFASSPGAEQKERAASRARVSHLAKVGKPKLPGRK